MGFRKTLLALALVCCGMGVAEAQPFGPQVISGQASFTTQGSALIITNTPKAIINWQGFSIGADELTRFNQQSAASSVLNRVVGNESSAILGALQSNGQVYLINPSGIFIGPGARIDVAGLIASTLDLSNQDFLAGRYNFKAGTSAGKLDSQGSITTPEGGQIYLIAPNVENSGILASPKGDILLAAGRSVQLVDSANPALQVVVSAPDHQALNLGQIIAQGGKIGIYGGLVSHKGTVNADSAVIGENGKVIFRASRDTLVEGNISATGAGRGGEIQVLGERVGILDGAKLDASGQTGGGTILVGGDYQGKNPTVQNAKIAYLGREAELHADAGVQGGGGRIIVWSDDTTRVYGTLSARGGRQGGAGGFVETSGRYLDIAGIRVNTGTTSGKGGTWLLDPEDIEIVAGSSSNPANPEGPTFQPADGSATSKLSAATLVSYLQDNGDAVVDTTCSGTCGSGSGRITVSAPLSPSLSADRSLTLKAHNGIVLNESISATGAKLNIELNADQGNTSSSSAMLTLASGKTVDSNGGWINITAVSTDLLGSLNAGMGMIEFYGDTVMQSSGSITADQVSLGTSGSVTLASETNAIKSVSGSVGGDLNLYTTTTLVVAPGNYTSFLTIGNGTATLKAKSISQEGGIIANKLDVTSHATDGTGEIRFDLDASGGEQCPGECGCGGCFVIGERPVGFGHFAEGVGNFVGTLKAQQADTGGKGIKFINQTDLHVESAVNQANTADGNIQIETRRGGNITLAGPITVTSPDAWVTLAIDNFRLGQPPLEGKISCESCLVTADTITFDTWYGDIGASGAPVHTQPVSGGTSKLYLGNSDAPPGSVYIQHDGNAEVDFPYNDYQDGAIDITASGDLTTSYSHAILSYGNVTLKSGGTLTIQADIEGDNITIATDHLYVDNTEITPKLWANEVAIKPYTEDTSVGIKLVSVPDLQNSDLEIAPSLLTTNIDAWTIRLGSTLSGPIYIDAALNLSSQYPPTLILESGSTISQSSSGKLSVGDLAIRALGDVTLTAAANKVAGMLVAEIGDSSNQNRNFKFKSDGNLTIGDDIDGIDGISIATSGSFQTSSPDGIISLVATREDQQAPAITLTQNTNGILSAKALSASAEIVDLSADNATPSVAGTASASSGAYFRYTTTGNMRIATVDGVAGISVPSGGDITLTSTGGGIAQDSDSVLTTTSGLSLTAADTVELNESGNSVGVLAADLNRSPGGTLSFKNSGALEIGAVGSTNGIITYDKDITVATVSGGITVSQSIDAGTTAGSVSLQANGTNKLLSIASGTTVTGKTGVALISDRVDIIGNVVASDVEIKSYTAGRMVTLGTNDVNSSSLSVGTLGLTATEIGKISADNLTISGGPIAVTGPITWGGTGKLKLSSTGSIDCIGNQLAAGICVNKTISANTLELLAAGPIVAGISVNALSATTTGSGAAISIQNAKTLKTISTSTSTGIISNNGAISLAATTGGIVLASPISAGSGDVVLVSAAGITNYGDVPAATADTFVVAGTLVDMTTVSGIGSTGIGGAIRTHAGSLFAQNTSSGGITIVNNTADSRAPLMFSRVENLGSGDISIVNYGELNTGTNKVDAHDGKVKLEARSPLIIGAGGVGATGEITLTAAGTGGTGNSLTVNGNVSSSGGGVTLSAYNNITISPSTSVSAGGTGTIAATATAGGITATGATLTTSGGAPITLTAGTTVSGAPAGATVVQGGTTGGGTSTPVVPTLSQCTANPALSGCSGVLPTLAQCTTSPSTAGCTAVLPSVGQCAANPALSGCSVVLPSTSQCTTNPGLSGCSAVLPTLSQCTANPALSGCSAILPSTSQCVANPGLAGCSAVLPTLSQCTANPALAGCSVVLPSTSQCATNPALSGCTTVLPTLSQCTANPSLTGCNAVLPSTSRCIASPGLAGCSAVLPTLSQCAANPALTGCSVILPSTSQCAANPALPGCSAILPTLSQCTANPALAGCNAVLPSLSQCTANPTLTGCSAILPSTSQCAANPALPGCSTILPTLSQCTAAPSLAGCSAVLPSASQCAANPVLAGCSAVLPTLSQCAANPGLPGCSATLPTLAQCVASPALAGCGAVLPSTSQCSANPALAGCPASTTQTGTTDPCVVTPGLPGCSTATGQGSSHPLEHAINETNNTINSSAPSSVTQPLQTSQASNTNQSTSQTRTAALETSSGSSDEKDDKKDKGKDSVKKDGTAVEDKKNEAPSKKQYCN